MAEITNVVTLNLKHSRIDNISPILLGTNCVLDFSQ